MLERFLNKQLVLLGGGHSHAIVLKMLAMNNFHNTDITLVSDQSYSPYSGMLPGYIAGHYSYEDIHIDIRRLCNIANVRFVSGKVIGIDPKQQTIFLAERPKISYELLSINCGATPAASTIKGADQYTTPVKPVWNFVNDWQLLLNKLTNMDYESFAIAIIGGGAGGVELALAMHYRLEQLRQHCRIKLKSVKIAIFNKESVLLTHQNKRTQKIITTICKERGIDLYLGEPVTETNEHGISWRNQSIQFDKIFLTTEAKPAEWLKSSGLRVDNQGFVAVNKYLQSLSHSNVFASGDIATIINYPRPKSGVFAVRQAQPLYLNLKRTLEGKHLESYQPQKYFLSLLSIANKSAVLSKANFGWHADWLWRLKNHIDKKFMRQFVDLPQVMSKKPRQQLSLHHAEPMHCYGCAAKLPKITLENVLERLELNKKKHLADLDQLDDAAIIKFTKPTELLQSIDFFPALIDDPFLMGRITTLHCFSDIFAMGGKALNCLALVALPQALTAIQEELAFQVLAGAKFELNKMSAKLVGGHSFEGERLSFGLSCNGITTKKTFFKKGLRTGDILVLTKPLGVGAIFAGHRRFKAKSVWLEEAIQTMLISNQKAAEIFLDYDVSACTDVTGFGLAGHLLEMLTASQKSCELYLSNIIPIQGALECFAQNIESHQSVFNQQAVSKHLKLGKWNSDNPEVKLLFDPQTSGGLLVSIAERDCHKLVADLKQDGYQPVIVGKVLSDEFAPISYQPPNAIVLMPSTNNVGL